MKAFVELQFGYCTLVWMFHSRSFNNKINRIHESALGSTYNNKSSSFKKLLQQDNSVTIHHRNIKILATEICRFLQELSSPIINESFCRKKQQLQYARE